MLRVVHFSCGKVFSLHRVCLPLVLLLFVSGSYVPCGACGSCFGMKSCAEQEIYKTDLALLFSAPFLYKNIELLIFCLCQFAPGFQVGDGIGMDLKLSNHVFNALKQHAYSEERRSARVHEKKEHSTAVSILSTPSLWGNSC